MTEGTLVASDNRGRYAIDDPTYGHDLTGGETCEIFLAGNWIPGSIEHGPQLYAVESIGQSAQKGYYFIAADGSICGLCCGMKVRTVQ